MTKEERLLRTVEKNLHMEETTEPGAEAPHEPNGPDTHGYMHISEQHATMMESEEMANQVLAKLTDQHINAQMRDPKISKEQKEKVRKYRAQELKKAKFALKQAQAPRSEKQEEYITTMQQGADLNLGSELGSLLADEATEDPMLAKLKARSSMLEMALQAYRDAAGGGGTKPAAAADDPQLGMNEDYIEKEVEQVEQRAERLLREEQKAEEDLDTLALEFYLLLAGVVALVGRYVYTNQALRQEAGTHLARVVAAMRAGGVLSVLHTVWQSVASHPAVLPVLATIRTEAAAFKAAVQLTSERAASTVGPPLHRAYAAARQAVSSPPAPAKAFVIDHV